MSDNDDNKLQISNRVNIINVINCLLLFLLEKDRIQELLGLYLKVGCSRRHPGRCRPRQLTVRRNTWLKLIVKITLISIRLNCEELWGYTLKTRLL